MNDLSYPLTGKQMRAKKIALFGLILMVLGSLGLDQITKKVAEDHLLIWQSSENLKEYQGRRFPVWSGGTLSHAKSEEPASFYLAFNFNYVRNQGAAWGFLSDWDDTYRIPFFYLVTFIAVMVIFFYLKSTPLAHRLARFSLAMVLSGAIGNFTDRIVRGYVVDFLDFRWVVPLPFTVNINFDLLNIHINTNAWRYNFPNFNWADSAITVGVIFLMIDMLILERSRQKAVSKSKA